jgi:hypothetical protein
MISAYKTKALFCMEACLPKRHLCYQRVSDLLRVKGSSIHEDTGACMPGVLMALLPFGYLW